MLVKSHIVDQNQIIERCKKGNQQAQAYLFRQYRSILFGVIMRYIKDPFTAEDILADSFVHIFQKIGQFKAKGSFEGWMKRIAVTQALMYLRANQKIFFTEEQSVFEEEVDAHALDQLEVEDIMECIRQLPEGYRAVFNLYVIEGYKHREIAELLGISIHTSKSQLIMARKKLVERLQSINYPGLQNYSA